MKKRYLIPTIVFLLFLCLIALLNINVSTRQGADYKVSRMTLPLYLKVLNFYYRHYNYKWLAKQITGHLDTKEDKILRLFHWTYETIKPRPKSLPIMDSHPWDVYVRGYGVIDNFHDLFSTLCNYIGTDAFFTVLYSKDPDHGIMLSFVRIKRGWVAFDPYRGVYFRNHTGGLATIEEMDEQDWHIVTLAQIDISKAYCEQYFDENLPNHIERIGSGFTRANTQSPINRLRFQLHRWLSGKTPLLE
jgi:hypothetical protein